MKKIILILTLIFSFGMYAQVGINETDPEGALDVKSSDSGLVIPRVANTGAVTNPSTANTTIADGTMIYDMSSSCIKAYENGSWSDCFSAGAPSTPVRRVTANTTITNADFGGVILADGGSTVTFPAPSGTFTPSSGDTITLTAFGTGSISPDFSATGVEFFGQPGPSNSDGSVTFIYFDNGIAAETGWYNINAQ